MNTFLYCCFLSVVIIIFAYINSQKILEKFSPNIRQIYRPYFRQARIMYGDFFDNFSIPFFNLYK